MSEPDGAGGFPETAPTVRQLSSDDWELFRDVRLRALSQPPSAFGSRHEDWVGAPPQRWRTRLTDVPGTWVALTGERPVGLISASSPQQADGGGFFVLLMSMWVAPTARGLGVGDLLVRSVVAWAGGQPGVARVELEVVADNLAAQKLYLRNGFRFARSPGDACHDGRRMMLPLPCTP